MSNYTFGPRAGADYCVHVSGLALCHGVGAHVCMCCKNTNYSIGFSPSRAITRRLALSLAPRIGAFLVYTRYTKNDQYCALMRTCFFGL
jgi:hypothetical protein